MMERGSFLDSSSAEWQGTAFAFERKVPPDALGRVLREQPGVIVVIVVSAECGCRITECDSFSAVPAAAKRSLVDNPGRVTVDSTLWKRDDGVRLLMFVEGDLDLTPETADETRDTPGLHEGGGVA